MAHGAFKVLDSDIHIIEPADLWPRYIDPAFRDQAPIGLTEDEGDLRLAHNGKAWGRVAIDADRSKRRQGRNYALNQERWRPYAERGWTSKVQLEAMDIEGIDVAVVYPSRGLFALTVQNMEPRLAAAMARAYNNWLYEFCQENPERLLGAGMISPFDVNDAVAETRRCVRELGFRAMFLRPNEVNGRNWHDPYYEPLWATLEELEIPLGFHEGSGSQLPQVGEQFGANTMLKHIYSHPVEQMLTAGAFCAGGILERHPRLRVALPGGQLQLGAIPALAHGRALGVAGRHLRPRAHHGSERVLQAAVLRVGGVLTRSRCATSSMPSATTASSSRPTSRTGTRSSRGRSSRSCSSRSRRRASARSCGTTARRTTVCRPDLTRRAQ